ncbi:hypothetical protein Trydic_g1895 [Trypoxylus dichotomus]
MMVIQPRLFMSLIYVRNYPVNGIINVNLKHHSVWVSSGPTENRLLATTLGVTSGPLKVRLALIFQKCPIGWSYRSRPPLLRFLGVSASRSTNDVSGVSRAEDVYYLARETVRISVDPTR